ncbi:hypothetical protein N7533_009169 [Penicillium manginii]|uniref:uncharacterized protein n=1 Tax=Penicillium manginii TaxID=203109 RepID=UPI002547E76E|nr:uncharacterized protein N7533_009169 [Penicillium manginii]KAJ5744299.1 hypothetical protein N7533_009169 [Penicillium manginii]
MGGTSYSSPISCTLIHGDSEAVLVDTPRSISQTEDLATWIKKVAPGNNLRYFRIFVLHKHWPNLRAIAISGTVEHMNEQIKPGILEGTWHTLFPGGQILAALELAELSLEHHDFRATEVGNTDAYNTTVLYVPSIRLVIVGDDVYGGVSGVVKGLIRDMCMIT